MTAYLGKSLIFDGGVRENTQEEKKFFCHCPEDKTRNNGIHWPYVRGFIIYDSWDEM